MRVSTGGRAGGRLIDLLADESSTFLTDESGNILEASPNAAVPGYRTRPATHAATRHTRRGGRNGYGVEAPYTPFSYLIFDGDPLVFNGAALTFGA